MMNRPVEILGILLVALSGCGARAELLVRPTPAQPDASDPDASEPDVVAPERCSLGPIVTLAQRTEPSFLLSLVETDDGYALTMASGWSGFGSPALRTFDRALRGTGEIATERLEYVSTIQGEPRLYARTSAFDRGTAAPRHAWYERAPLRRVDLGPLCDGCAMHDRPAVTAGNRIAVPFGTGVLDSGGALLVTRDGLLAPGASAMDLRSPALLPARDALLAISQAGASQLTRVLFTIDGQRAQALRPVTGGYNGASAPWLVRASDGAIAAIGMSVGGGRVVPLTMSVWSSDASLSGDPDLGRTLAAAGPTAQGLSALALASQGRVAVAWGEQTGDSGAWLTVLDTRGRPVMPQRLASDPVGNTQSYTIYTALAPHPEGFVLAWSGWQRASNYGIYARVVRCD